MALPGQRTDREYAKFILNSLGETAINVVPDPGASQPIQVTDTAYLGGIVTVSTVQAEAKVGASPLASRKVLYIENRSGANIFFGPTGVTTSTGAKLANNQATYLSVGPAIHVYLIKAAGSGDAIIQEYS